MKYINEFDHKAHLFIDMDGTLATWQQTACFEDLLQENYFRDLPPYQVPRLSRSFHSRKW